MDKEKVSPEELKHTTLEKAQNIISNLQKAYANRPANMSFHEEKKMLEIMMAAKKLAESVQKVFTKLELQKRKTNKDQK